METTAEVFGGRVAALEGSLAVVLRSQVVVVVVGDRTRRGVMEDLAYSGEGVEGMRLVEAVVSAGNVQTRCSGCMAASPPEKVASPGKVVVRIVGGILGVVVVRRPRPWASSSWQARAARSCWIRDTCP